MLSRGRAAPDGEIRARCATGKPAAATSWIGVCAMTSDAEILRQLTAFIRSSTGDPSAQVSALTALPCHAGLSYSFELATAASGGGVARERLVLRLAPEGVRPTGPADVVKQARI